MIGTCSISASESEASSEEGEDLLQDRIPDPQTHFFAVHGPQWHFFFVAAVHARLNGLLAEKSAPTHVQVLRLP